ncbi:FAD-dependent oxidoreductase [Gordonibacter sp.]|uniref:FAD-dependent oxidoreductase n=2 Tax=Gordonibacter sp. TaxID=1968902 RepID=UPI002FCA9F21
MGNTEDTRFSRRNFLKGAGVAAVAAAGGMLAGCSGGGSTPAQASSGEQAVNWSKEVDVVVCGYGAAGAACAIEAAAQGASVLIVEKAALSGGSMARCGGAIMGAPTKIQQSLDVKDSADALYDWVMTCTDGTCSKDIARAYADVAGPNVDWLDALAEEHLGYPCFEMAMAKANVGTADGGHNGAVGGCLDATGCEYEKFGVKLEEAVPRTHWAKATPDNTANSGPELFDPLKACIDAQSTIEAVYETALKRLVTNADGVVVGIEAEGKNGTEFYKANKGVMLATGGFPAGLEMQERFCQDALDYATYMSDVCTGDGIKAAMGVGADLYNMCNYYPIEVAQSYHYNVQYNDVYHSWNMDKEGYMEVPAMNLAETHGGLAINADAQVLDVWGQPIEHLYCSGCDTGTNIFGIPGNYPGCGCYVSFSIAFGRIAGEKMATA